VIAEGLKLTLYFGERDRVDGKFLADALVDLSFMDDDVECGSDLEAGLKQVIKSLGIGATRAGVTLSVSGGLARGDIREVDERDRTTFFPGAGLPEWPVIYARREPEWAVEAESVAQEGGVAEASVTTSMHLTVGAIGRAERVDELRKVAEDVAASPVPTT
jgi:hypothetical protein